MRSLLFVLFASFVVNSPAGAAEPFLQKGDVIALVGGEDMVVAGELGYLELLLTRALPDYHLRFRSLAWEGDTVFEQRRDLNFPPLEAQLDQIGATVVICQFGQMESLAGKEKLPEFIDAYDKLITRLRGKAGRRIVLFGPSAPLEVSKDTKGAEILTVASRVRAFESGVRQIGKEQRIPFLSVTDSLIASPAPVCVGDDRELTPAEAANSRRAVEEWRVSLHNPSAHLSEDGHRILAEQYCFGLLGGTFMMISEAQDRALLALIRAKNRLWFNYWRVQNWAFLAGDRTEQPSSRDWRDPTKRWFPAEREAFLPLIAAKEAEIDALAAQLAGERP